MEARACPTLVVQARREGDPPFTSARRRRQGSGNPLRPRDTVTPLRESRALAVCMSTTARACLQRNAGRTVSLGGYDGRTVLLVGGTPRPYRPKVLAYQHARTDGLESASRSTLAGKEDLREGPSPRLRLHHAIADCRKNKRAHHSLVDVVIHLGIVLPSTSTAHEVNLGSGRTLATTPLHDAVADYMKAKVSHQVFVVVVIVVFFFVVVVILHLGVVLPSTSAARAVLATNFQVGHHTMDMHRAPAADPSSAACRRSIARPCLVPSPESGKLVRGGAAVPSARKRRNKNMTARTTRTVRPGSRRRLLHDARRPAIHFIYPIVALARRRAKRACATPSSGQVNSILAASQMPCPLHVGCCQVPRRIHSSAPTRPGVGYCTHGTSGEAMVPCGSLMRRPQGVQRTGRRRQLPTGESLRHNRPFERANSTLRREPAAEILADC